jgi:hypothetical protein
MKIIQRLPGSGLARISDPRVKQFWDKDHLIAKQLDQQLSTSQPNCCRRASTLWNVVALYPKGFNGRLSTRVR